MKKFVFILSLTLLTAFYSKAYSVLQDTIVPAFVEEKAEEAIEDIILTKKAPSKDKVQYVSQLTRYGFKNLFTAFGYNTSMSYSSQVNPHAEAFMQDYLRSHSASLNKMKTWGITYFNLIDNILTQYGLPRELKYLAVIESNLSTSATSWVGAGGPWQFMPYTARDYGLIVNNTVDERRDYFKSTHAAARYLLQLYKQMNDWLLVIAAYNGGPGRVYEAIRKSGSRNFWTLQNYLPQESRNHVKKFIATHYIMETDINSFGTNNNFYANAGAGNPYEKNNGLSEEELASTETQTVSGKYSSTIIAKNLEMDLKTFHRYNPLFDDKLSINGQYELTLPAEKMQQFLAIKYQILNECVQLLLDDNNIPSNKTVYPQSAPSKKKKRS